MSPSARRVVTAGAIGALLAPTLINPNGSGPVLCPLRRVTGVWCPGCGMTRAAGWLAHGEWSAAWTLHPWVYALALQVALIGVVLAAARRRRHDLFRNRWVATSIIAINSAGLFAVWVFRLTWGAFPID